LDLNEIPLKVLEQALKLKREKEGDNFDEEKLLFNEKEHEAL